MVTIKQLRKNILKEKAKERKIFEKKEEEFEKFRLEKELKGLKRSPGAKRNIELLKRTGRGLKILGGKARKFTIKQAERIRKQQLRDEAAIKKTGKKKFKKLNNNLFDDLDF